MLFNEIREGVYGSEVGGLQDSTILDYRLVVFGDFSPYVMEASTTSGPWLGRSGGMDAWTRPGSSPYTSAPTDVFKSVIFRDPLRTHDGFRR